MTALIQLLVLPACQLTMFKQTTPVLNASTTASLALARAFAVHAKKDIIYLVRLAQLVLQIVRPAQIPPLVPSARQDSTSLTMPALAAALHAAHAIKKTQGIHVILAFLTTTLIMTRVKLVVINTHLLARLQRAAGNRVIATIAMTLVLLVQMMIIPMIVCPAMKAHPLIHHN